MHTREILKNDAVRLGIESGDTIFVHSSFKSIGPVDGGAAAVVRGLEDSIGQDGLLLMPSFNLKPRGAEARTQAWNRDTTSSSVGWLTEFFRTMPGAVRSDHHSHSVAARGKDAKAFVSEVFVFWDQLNHQKRGKIGDADCRLFLIREFLDIMLDAVKADAKRFFKQYLD